MITEPVVYSTGRVHVAFTTSPSGKYVIRVSGDASLLQNVKTGLKQFVQRIIHKTVTFRRAGRKISKTYAKGSKRQLFWFMHLEVATKPNYLKLQLNYYTITLCHMLPNGQCLSWVYQSFLRCSENPSILANSLLAFILC